MMPSLLKRLIRRPLRATGYDVIPLWRMHPCALANLALAAFLRTLFRELEIDLVIDVGAHQGEYGLFLRQLVGYGGQILSFEPSSESLSVLRQKAADDPKWQVEGVALGSEPGTMQLNIMRHSELNSFLDPDLSAVSETGIQEWEEGTQIIRRESVNVATLAQYLAHRQNSRIYLKLDTQGFDLKIVEAAGDGLASVCALQTELSLKSLYQNPSTGLAQSISRLNEMGYEVSGFYPVSMDRKRRIVDLDCVMVRSGWSHTIKA